MLLYVPKKLCDCSLLTGSNSTALTKALTEKTFVPLVVADSG